VTFIVARILALFTIFLLENVTITANRTTKRHGKQKSQECVPVLSYRRIMARVDNISQGSALIGRLYPYDGALL
jgi:hypothetical protein